MQAARMMSEPCTVSEMVTPAALFVRVAVPCGVVNDVNPVDAIVGTSDAARDGIEQTRSWISDGEMQPSGSPREAQFENAVRRAAWSLTVQAQAGEASKQRTRISRIAHRLNYTVGA